MSIWRLVFQEIRHRKLNFLLAMLSVIMAVACFTGFHLAFNKLSAETDQRLAETQKRVKETSKQLGDLLRKQTKNLGFNIRILPKDADMKTFYDEGYSDKTMPESYVKTLADAGFLGAAHLFPVIQTRLDWPELDLKSKILFYGSDGEVKIKGRDLKKPLEKKVLAGKIVLGHQLAIEWQQKTGETLKVGDKVTFRSKEYEVAGIKPRLGNREDYSVSLNLREAQQLLDKKDQISMILALECVDCKDETIPVIYEKIESVLPEARLDRYSLIADSRAEMRLGEARQARADDKKAREESNKAREDLEFFASITIPLVLLGSIIWLAVVALSNVHDRRAEVGILRTLGLRSKHILFLFLSKSFLVGLVGALTGIVVGMLLFRRWEASSVLLFIVLLAPVVSLLASWIPALIATRQDPAVTLRE